MSKKTITVYEGLSELKKLDKQIEKIKNTDNIGFIFYKRCSDDIIDGMSIDDIKKNMTSNLQSIQHLISNYKEIKSKIEQSNAITKVTIGEKEYTVAEAIARKKLIEFEESFLKTLKNQYAMCVNKVKNTNDKVSNPTAVADYISRTLGDCKKTQELIDSQTKTYHALNDYELVDPSNLKQVIDSMENDIESFKVEINFKLVASNAITTIDLELED